MKNPPKATRHPPRLAIYPGTFDPITNGHVDIIRRAAPLFDRVIVTLAVNSEKRPLFTVAERMEMIRRAVADIPNVDLGEFRGLVVDYAHEVGAIAIIRGLRAISDYEYEFQMALMNRKQRPELDTIFLMPDEKFTYLSSTIVREIAGHNGNLNGFVPPFVEQALRRKYRKNGRS